MTTVRQILQSKDRRLWSVTPTDSVGEALQIMADNSIKRVLVIEEGKLVGIFSEMDYARIVILEGKSYQDRPVHEVMTNSVLYVTLETSIEECMSLMTAEHVRHLAVTEYDQLAGILTFGDVVKKIISEQQFTINQLENYITGKYVS